MWPACLQSDPTTYKSPSCCSAMLRRSNGAWHDTGTRQVSSALSRTSVTSPKQPTWTTLSTWPERESSHQVKVLVQAPLRPPLSWLTVKITCQYQAHRWLYRTQRHVRTTISDWSLSACPTRWTNNGWDRSSRLLQVPTTTQWTTSALSWASSTSWLRWSALLRRLRRPQQQVKDLVSLRIILQQNYSSCSYSN